MRACLFDLDGTLAASEGLKAQALAQACSTYGVDADYRIYAQVMGEDWPTVTGHFFDAYALSVDVLEFDRRFRGYYLALIEAEVGETSGAAAFVHAVRRQGLRVGVVSSAAPWMVDAVLSRLRLESAFDLIVTQADVASHKPDPAAYLLALGRLALPPEDVLVFEDSFAGLSAASAAGCPSIAVRHAFNASHDFTSAGRIIESFHELAGVPPEDWL